MLYATSPELSVTARIKGLVLTAIKLIEVFIG